MRRFLAVSVSCVCLAGCGGGGEEPVDRDALVAYLVDGVRGTVGADGVPCVKRYLRERTDEELDRLANERGVDDLDRAYTDAVVACAER